MLRGAVLAVFAWAALARDASVTNAAVWRAPLQHHTSASYSDSVRAAHATLATMKTHSSVWEPAFPGPASVDGSHAPVPVDFSVREGFAATVSFGTPPQPVSVMLDIDSALALVLNHDVDGRQFYDHTQSSTYQSNGTRVRVVDFTGFVSRDHVSLGGAAAADRIDVPDHLLVELDGPDQAFRQLGPKFGGWIGLGPGRAARTTGAPSLPRAMIDQGQLDRPVIGMSFRDPDAHVVFGGVDAAYEHSDFHYFGVADGMWKPPLSGISVDGHRVVGDVDHVQLSYWPFVIGPKDAIDALAHAVGAKDGELPCDGPGPGIVLQLGDGFTVTVAKKDYTLPTSKSGVCKFLFVAIGFDVWQLGLPFLRSVYTVLDYGKAEGDERIGFTQVKQA